MPFNMLNPKQNQYYFVTNNNGNNADQKSISPASNLQINQLPDNYHGLISNKPSLVQMARTKYKERHAANIQDVILPKKIVNWQKKRFDQDVKKQRRNMLVHPGRISQQNPQHFKTTYDFFRRNSLAPRLKQSRAQWESFDVFGRKRQLSWGSIQKSAQIKRNFSLKAEVTQKVGSNDRFRITTFKQVTPKIGSVQFRDFSFPRSQIKVGKTEFVNTYSPF